MKKQMKKQKPLDKCKHTFKSISNASGGWQSKDALVQCSKCKKVFVYDPIDKRLHYVKIEEK